MLKTRQEITETERAANAAVAYDEYFRWIDENLSSEIWLAVRERLESGFSGGFTKFK
ncbi:hypothetical protein [Acrocarpospora catenulata]|uniref:hypothetical protein n=1 Tax=Acrocarpospora catenulata TaxID=2836182 RepID=UPI001BD9CBBC|nr:hypothetical protein [Acrocarpospora catenulata]